MNDTTSKLTPPERDYFYLLIAHRLPVPEQHNHRFAWAAMRRRWALDWAWPDLKLGVEIEGGVYGWRDPQTREFISAGRHTRGKGYEGDLEKYNAAALLGWTVLRFSAQQATTAYAVETTRQALALRLSDNSVVVSARSGFKTLHVGTILTSHHRQEVPASSAAACDARRGIRRTRELGTQPNPKTPIR